MTVKLNNPFKISELISSVNNIIDTKQDSLTAGNNIVIENNVISANTSTIKVGYLAPFSSAKTGWLLCDGSKVLIENYQDLYNVIGNTYGDSGDMTLFCLPNFTTIPQIYILYQTNYIPTDSLLSEISNNQLILGTQYNYWA